MVPKAHTDPHPLDPVCHQPTGRLQVAFQQHMDVGGLRVPSSILATDQFPVSLVKPKSKTLAPKSAAMQSTSLRSQSKQAAIPMPVTITKGKAKLSRPPIPKRKRRKTMKRRWMILVSRQRTLNWSWLKQVSHGKRLSRL